MLPQLKQDIVIEPVSTTNGASATGLIDTLAYDWLTIDVLLSTSDNVTNNPSVLKLAQCDTSNGSFTDITEFVGDGAGGFTIPNCVTSGEWGMKFNIDALPLKRWLKLTVTPITTQTVTAIANLGRGAQAPNSAARANVKVLVEG